MVVDAERLSFRRAHGKSGGSPTYLPTLEKCSRTYEVAFNVKVLEAPSMGTFQL